MANNDLVRREDILAAVRDIPYLDSRSFSVSLEKVMNAIANVPGVTVTDNEITSLGVGYAPFDYDDNLKCVCIESIEIGEHNNNNNEYIASAMVDINRIIENNINAAYEYGKKSGEAEGYATAKWECIPASIGDVYDFGSEGAGIIVGFDDECDIEVMFPDFTTRTKYRYALLDTKKLGHIEVMAEALKVFEEMQKNNPKDE